VIDVHEQRLQAMPWWSSPAGISLGFLLPVLFLIAYVGETNHPGLTIRGVRFLSLEYIGLGAGALLVTALGGWVGGHLSLRKEAVDAVSAWDVIAAVIGSIAVGAYVIWFRDYFIDPGLIVRTIFGEHRPDRTNIELTPGITSLVNVAPVFFSIYAYRWLNAGSMPVLRAVHWMCAVLVAFTVFRVYAWSERLALVEAAVPFALACGARAMTSARAAIVGIRRLGPYVAMPALVLYFGVAEYARSWSSATYHGKLGFWDFAVGRFASYYYTSLNNGAGVLATADWPTYRFENVLLWLHKAPLSVGPLFSTMVNATDSRFDAFLQRFGDPEFNNPSGLYAVIADFGLPLGLVYFFLIAVAGGLCFRAYREGRFFGVLFWPVFFISFLEVFRYPYLGTPRAFTWCAGALLASLLIALMRSAPMRSHAAICRTDP